MAFNLPSAQYLMNQDSGINRGIWVQGFQTGLKSAGNLPITTNAAQVINSGGTRSIWFGLRSQNSAITFDASTDTKVLLTSVQFNAPNRIQVNTIANGGVVARIGSSASDYREFQIGGNDTPFAAAQAGAVTICLDLNATSQDSSGGAYDPAAAERWGYSTSRSNLTGSPSNYQFFQRVFLFDTTKNAPNMPNFTGSNSNWSDAFSAVQGSSYTTTIGKWLVQVGSAYFVPCPFQLGDGSTATIFDDAGATIVSPEDNASGAENFRLSNQAMRVYLAQRNNAADSVTLSGTYVWGTAAPRDFDEDNLATCTLSGNFNGMGDFTIGGSVTASGVFTLASGSKVISNGANPDNITVNGDMDIQGAAVTTFTGMVVTGVLDFGSASTYTLDGCTVSEITNSSGGSIVLNLINGSTVSTNSGPSITVNEVTTLTLTGLQTNSEVRVYDAGTTTELAGVENSGTSFSANISAASVDIVVHSLGFEYQKIEGADTSANLTLPIQQRVDRNYRNP